ncbi:DUF5906 domain-containing protein [uncultured Oscillibacter sp.]|uniref:DNA primase family protein n=1 Tax=uncultured Oscillibacter sp. TaxID=876091 RepID=UPI0026243708|nr:DUF5906 domain-containing protein [uncultured Oscillibacter sp.]
MAFFDSWEMPPEEWLSDFPFELEGVPDIPGDGHSTPFVKGVEESQEIPKEFNLHDFATEIESSPSFENLQSHRESPWQDPEESDHFMVKSQRQPFPNFEGYVPLPDLFPLGKRLYKPLCLTDVEGGLYRQKADRNLSEIAQYLLDNLEIADVGGRLAVFRQPDWEILNPQTARREILAFIAQSYPDVGKYLGSRQLEEIIERLLCSPEIRHLEHLPAANPHAICCSDQLYVWPEGRRLEANHMDFRFSHLEISSIEIGPVPTPYFDDFLRVVAENDEDLCSLILEVIGVILTGYPCKNFFVFEGVPSSGKSQLARFLQGILGETSCFAVNGINELAGRWTTGMLPGKLLCLCSDVPDKPLTANVVGLVKQLTGDDPIHGERKYQNPFVFQNTAKLLFLTNFPLRIAGGRQDAAILQRLVRVPFRHSVPQDQQIPRLYEHLLVEAGGIVWQALQALSDMEERGGGFTEIRDTLDEEVGFIPTLRERVDEFVHNACISDVTARISTRVLFDAFVRYYTDGSFQNDISPIQFGKAFAESVPQLGDHVKPYRTATERGYVGIRLKDDYT